MNRFVVQSGSPCTVLLVRTKATLMRRKRTPEWHEKDKASRQQQMDKLSGEYELMKTQLNVLRQRLKDKNTVTSFRGVLVERTLTKRVSGIVYFLLLSRNCFLISLLLKLMWIEIEQKPKMIFKIITMQISGGRSSKRSDCATEG